MGAVATKQQTMPSEKIPFFPWDRSRGVWKIFAYNICEICPLLDVTYLLTQWCSCCWTENTLDMETVVKHVYNHVSAVDPLSTTMDVIQLTEDYITVDIDLCKSVV